MSKPHSNAFVTGFVQLEGTQFSEHRLTCVCYWAARRERNDFDYLIQSITIRKEDDVFSIRNAEYFAAENE